MTIQHLVVLFLFSSLVFGVDGVNILSATHQRKLVDSLNDRLELGIYEVEFDEPLSIVETFGHCNYLCPFSTPTCAPCDYSDPAVCAGSRVNDTECPCPISEACNLPFINADGASLESSVEIEGAKYFAFFIEPELSCHMFLLELFAFNADLKVSVALASDHIFAGDNAFEYYVNLQSTQQNPDSVMLCPTSSISGDYLPGTYLVRVTGSLTTPTGFSLSLRSKPLPTPLNNASATCTPATSNHTCLIDDVEYYTILDVLQEASVFLYFSFKLPVQCPLPLTIFSNQPYIMSMTKVYPDFVNGGSDPSTLLLETSFRERNVRSVCVTQENTYLYLAVPGLQLNPKAESTLSIRISTNPGLFYTRLISDYSARALPFALSATSSLLAQQQRFMCDSFGAYKNGCAGYWHLYSGEEVNPIMPSPPRIIRDNIANLQDVTITPLNSNKYAVAVVLSERRFDSVGFRRMTRSEFEAGTMFFTRLADSQGKPILLNTTFVPKQAVECNYRRFNSHHTRITEIMRQLTNLNDELVVNSFRLELNGILAYDSYSSCQTFAERLLVTETTQETTVTDKCVTSWDDPAFDKDPCCIQPASWFVENLDGTVTILNDTCGTQNATFPTQSLVAVSSNAVRDQCISAPCVTNLAERYFQVSARQSHPLVGCDANFISYDAFSALVFNVSDCPTSGDVDGSNTYCILNNTFPSVLDRLATRLNVTIDISLDREQVLQQWSNEFQFVNCIYFDTTWEVYVNDPIDACKIYSCNWAAYNSISLSNDTLYEYCVTNPFEAQFCGECSDARAFCRRSNEFFDQDTCAGTRCQLRNGTSISVVDLESECSAKSFCTRPCNGGDCPTEQDCINASSCNDEFFDFTVGKCIDTISGEDWTCGQSQYDNDTARVFVSGMGCYEPLADETQCLNEVPGGRWVTRTTSEAACNDLNKVFCDIDLVSYTNLTISECEARGGNWGFFFGWVFRWTQATWAPGFPMTLQWLNRTVDLKYGTATRAWDTDRLTFNAMAVITDLYSIEQSAAAKCRSGQASELINAIACSCASDGERSNACFEQYNPTTALTQQVVCRGVQNYIYLQQADVLIESNDMIRDSSICTLVQNSLIDPSQLEVITNNELSNFFLRFSRDTNRIVQNSNNATIGKIVSDGLAFDFNSDAEIFRARVCIEGNVTGVDLVRFGVADIGVADLSTKSITPMSVPVSWNGTHFCGFVMNMTDKSDELNTNVFFFIQRTENWQEQMPQMEFTQAELGLVILLIICYTFTLGFSGYRIIQMIQLGFAAQIKILIYCFLAGLFLVRLLYFLLLVGNVFAIESRGDYVLIELPSFLYFSTLSVYVIVWAVSLRAALDMGNSTKTLLQRVTMIVNGSIYLIFILLIILYETLRPAPVVECNGLLVTNDLATSSGIALAYRLFVTSISFALMICFAVYGIKATVRMSKNSQIKSKNEAKNRTMQTTAISATGLLVQCLYFLLLLVVNFQNNILSLVVLLVVEVGVGVTLLVLTDVHKKTSSTSGTSGTRMSRTGGGSNNTGGNSTNSSGTN